MIYFYTAVILPATNCLDYCGIMNRVGEVYLAPDGFNVCVCTKKGPQCTTNVCPGNDICDQTWVNLRLCEENILNKLSISPLTTLFNKPFDRECIVIS